MMQGERTEHDVEVPVGIIELEDVSPFERYLRRPRCVPGRLLEDHLVPVDGGDPDGPAGPGKIADQRDGDVRGPGRKVENFQRPARIGVICER
jgi:hypothetical protein